MPKSLYCTTDVISYETGGGAATVNELEALKSVSDVAMVISRDDILPAKYHQPPSPFLEDYFALQMVKGKHFDIAHFYSGCFTETINYLRHRGVRVSFTVAAHDRHVSIEEFHRLGLEYPYHHVSDDNLFMTYTEGIRMANIVFTQSGKSIPVLQNDVRYKGRIEVVPGGIIWPKEVKPLPKLMDPKLMDAAYIGAVGPDKGLIYLLKAWSQLDYKDCKLILAGGGTENLEPFIKQVADGGQFQLLGRVPDVAGVYNSCAIYIQPSVSEGFALEIPEAMSYGRAVIASEGAGASEIIKDGVDGLRAPIRDPQAIAERIDWLKRHPELISEIGQKAQEKAKDYTWEKAREKYANIFSKL